MPLRPERHILLACNLREYQPFRVALRNEILRGGIVSRSEMRKA